MNFIELYFYIKYLNFLKFVSVYLLYLIYVDMFVFMIDVE